MSEVEVLLKDIQDRFNNEHRPVTEIYGELLKKGGKMYALRRVDRPEVVAMCADLIKTYFMLGGK